MTGGEGNGLTGRLKLICDGAGLLGGTGIGSGLDFLDEGT